LSEDPRRLQTIAEFLFGLLDDIDTLDDACRDDDATFREQVRKVQQRRFEVAVTDGQEVWWKPQHES